MTARVLVTGASGFIGRSIVANLAAKGRVVIASGRVAPDVPPSVQSVAMGDLTKGINWSFPEGSIDTIVHCAARAHILREHETDPLALFRAVNRDATVALARAAAASGVRRFVFLSSIGVNGDQTADSPFTAQDTPNPHSDYAVAKWEAEQALAEVASESKLQVVTIRPPLVIGPEPKGNLGALSRAIAKGLPLPLGQITRNRRDLVSLDTLADLVAAAIDHPNAPGGVLLVSDGNPLSTRDIAAALGAAIGCQPRFLPVPPALLRLALSALGKASVAGQLLGNLELNISDTCRRLGWQPPRRVA